MDLDEQIRRDFEELQAKERKKRGLDKDFGKGAGDAAGKPMGDKPDKDKERPQRPVAKKLPAAMPRPAVPLITPDVQAGVLQGAIDQATDAISDENKSRVSQLREMRRMQHEKDVEMIRAQAALERVRQARERPQYSGEATGNIFDGGRLIDLTGTARRVG